METRTLKQFPHTWPRTTFFDNEVSLRELDLKEAQWRFDSGKSLVAYVTGFVAATDKKSAPAYDYFCKLVKSEQGENPRLRAEG